MADENNNGVDDNVEKAIEQYAGKDRRVNVDMRSAVVGGIIALSLGSLTLVLGRSMFPDNAAIIGVGQWFAGSVCDPVREKLEKYEQAWACIEGGAAVQGVDISLCEGKLSNE